MQGKWGIEMKFHSAASYIRLLQQEQRALKAERRQQLDPTGANRQRFLRQLHKEPLMARARDVLGPWASLLLPRLKKSIFHDDADTFDKKARNILRKCKKIVGPDELRRRRAYVDACIANERRLEMLPETNVVVLLAEKLGISEKKAWGTCYQLIGAMLWRIDHEGISAEMLGDRACAIAMKASRARYPKRYLSTVIRNEGLEHRQEERRNKARKKKVAKRVGKKDRANG